MTNPYEGPNWRDDPLEWGPPVRRPTAFWDRHAGQRIPTEELPPHIRNVLREIEVEQNYELVWVGEGRGGVRAWLARLIRRVLGR